MENLLFQALRISLHSLESSALLIQGVKHYSSYLMHVKIKTPLEHS